MKMHCFGAKALGAWRISDSDEATNNEEAFESCPRATLHGYFF
jgi:hypothetical protein